MGIQAAYLAPIILLIRFLLKTYTKKTTVIVWIPFLFRLLCPASIALPVSIMAWAPYSTQSYTPVSLGFGSMVISELNLLSPEMLNGGKIGRTFPYIWLLCVFLIILISLTRLYHLRREKRFLIDILLLLLCAFYWYNPVVWFCCCLIKKDCRQHTKDVSEEKSNKLRAVYSIVTILVIGCMIPNPFNNQDALSRQSVLEFQGEMYSENSDSQDYILHIINTAKRQPLSEEEQKVSWYGETASLCELKVRAPDSARVVVYELLLYHHNGYSLFYGEMEYGIVLKIKEADTTEKWYRLPYEVINQKSMIYL